jgi:hypothetical protein
VALGKAMAIHSVGRRQSYDDRQNLYLRNNPPMVTFYIFFKTDKIPRFARCCAFNDDIPNAEALIAAVTKYVRQYNIKVLDRRDQTKEPRPRLS